MSTRSDLDALELYEPVYAFVRQVPAGRVVTYGQVADSIRGVSLTARQVGSAMAIAPSGVPWHRVVGATGKLPIARRGADLQLRQAQLLADEGVPFCGTDGSTVDMRLARWPDHIAPSDGLFAE